MKNPASGAQITTAIVEDIIRATQETVILLCRPDTIVPFAAGQFAYLQTPEMAHPRPYSIASAEGNALLGFHIKTAPASPTTEAFARLKRGDTIKIDMPHGKSRLEKEAETPFIAIAGGVGIAPVHSIITTAQSHNPARPAHLYWGCNTAEELYLHDLFRNLEQNNPHFLYTPVLLRPHQDFAAGLVGEHIEKASHDWRNTDIYLAGPKDMMLHTIGILEALGTPEEKLHYDRFW